jgi:phenylacetate-coenzyme A ligase PaaK-like adenylate-forming protein
MQARRKIYNFYNSLPYSLKSYISILSKNIPNKYIFGKDFRSTLNRIKETEYWSTVDLSNLRSKKLQRILLHAFKTTPFYRRMMTDKDITEASIDQDPDGVLRMLDFIDKAVIRDNFNDFISDNRRSIPNDYCSTGGTSGEPFYFYMDSSRSSKEWAFITDQWSRVGYNLNSRRATFRGSRIRGKGWEDDWITKERRFSSFELTDEYLANIWPLFSKFDPEFIYAYPTNALILCQFSERHNKRLPTNLKAFLLGSENIYDGQREYIESVSGRKVFLWYGHSEKLVLAGECEKTKYYHAYPQYGYAEFINDQGKTAKPGEFAEIVGTGFSNTVMPFIRYKTGDFCTYLGEHCPECGRNCHIFSDIKGRWTQEYLLGFKGNRISMSAINVHSNTFQNVFRFQFYQDDPGAAILKLVPKEGFSEKDRKALEIEFNDKFAGNIKVTSIAVDSIPLTKSGKWKFIDQKIDLKINS